MRALPPVRISNLGDAWRTDEIFVKFSGKMEYVFALMDDQTRFWIAQQVATNEGEPTM
jgi:transposase-like protein